MNSTSSKSQLILLAGLTLVLLQGEGAALAATTGLSDAASAQEQALRRRVEDFYSLLQLARWNEAETYITEDTRENFRQETKVPFLGFQVESVKLDPGGQSGTGVVQLQVIVAGFPSGPMPVVKTTHWKLVDGSWHVVIPKRDPNALKALFNPAPGNGSSRPAPPAEQLKFKGHTYNLAQIPPGKVKAARFPFTNVTDHVVSIADVATGCECLKVKLEKKDYKPGESGELVVEFDPSNFEREYAQTIVVKTDPGSLITYLMVKGDVIPRPRDGPKAEGNLTR